MDELTNPPTSGTEVKDTSGSVATYPSEPFACPACGQLLAPNCRVCVACRQPIDFSAVGRQPVSVLPTYPAILDRPQVERVHFPWRILIVVMCVGMIVAQISLALWGEDKGLLVVQGLLILTGVWVFFDAVQRRIPRPLRWGLGTILLLAVVLPWYLARRNKPQATVAFEEVGTGVIIRFVLVALLVFFLIGLIINVVQGPQPVVEPAPKFQPSGNSSHVRLRFPTQPNSPPGSRLSA
jgi:hypothetical protein